MLNERRRNYRDKLKKALKISNIKRQDSIRKRPNQKGMSFSKGDNLTATVIRYVDGCETLIS